MKWDFYGGPPHRPLRLALLKLTKHSFTTSSTTTTTTTAYYNDLSLENFSFLSCHDVVCLFV